MNAKPRSKELAHYYRRRQQGDHLHRIWAKFETHRLFAGILAENGMTAEGAFADMVRHEAKRLGVT